MRRIRREPIVGDAVTTQIRAAILNGSLAPGARIRQEDLAARLGVSRVPVRHALLVLERDGLVHREGRRGAVVASLDAQFVGDVYDFRAAIDAHVAATLAARGEFDPTPFERIVADGRAAVRTGDLARLIELDSRFHVGLYEAEGNRVLVHVMRSQWTHLRRAMAITLTISGYRAKVWDEHAAILDVITRRQVDRARDLAMAHTTNARAILLANLHASTATREAPLQRVIDVARRERAIAGE